LKLLIEFFELGY